MYKLVVVSDSHHAVGNFKSILHNVNLSDYLVYCGDGINDLMSLRGAITVPIVSVRGNCDVGSHISDTASFTIGDTRVMVTHGHVFDVKRTAQNILAAAKAKNCKLVFFGHTHNFIDSVIDGVRFINPGSLANGSYAGVCIDGQNIVCRQMTV